MEDTRAHVVGTVHDLAQVDVKDQVARGVRKTRKKANAQARHVLYKAAKAARPAAAARGKRCSRRGVSVPLIVLAVAIVCVVVFRLRSKGTGIDGTHDSPSSDPVA
jgi:hypothetical protein